MKLRSRARETPVRRCGSARVVLGMMSNRGVLVEADVAASRALELLGLSTTTARTTSPS